MADRRKLSLLGTILAAATALFTAGQHSAGVAGIPAPSSGVTAAVHRETSAPSSGTCPNVSTNAQPEKLLKSYLDADREFLIAAVPDPQITNLALFTDRVLESLTWAISDAQYNFVRYWVPWQTTADPELSSLADRKCREKEIGEQHDRPGVLVFRKRASAKEGKSLLIVFLVSETPSGGISEKALKFAVDYITQDKPNTELKIVGPTFSGSLQPLAVWLNNLFVKYPSMTSVHLVSGTLTSAQAICGFRSSLGKKFATKVKDQYVIENDDRAGVLFFNFIKKEWRQTGESGLLSEDDTAYGNVAEQIINEVSPSTDVAHKWLSLRYPRDISRLRNAPQSAAANDTKKPSESVVEGVSQDLKDSSGAGSTGSDSFPSFSKIQSPASQQAALLQISSALKREHVEYTGIIATDVLDSLFLSRFLRQSFPDTRVFTLDADLLFPRENETAPLEGVLAVTTYPLISRNQHWTAAQLAGGIPRRVPFTCRSAEGVYNACRYLLQHDPNEEWTKQKKGELLLEYARPETDMPTHHPPLWLTVVGRRGYWPLALLDDEEKSSYASSLLWLDDKHVYKPQETLHPESPSGGWYLCTGLLVLLALLHCIYVVFLSVRSFTGQQIGLPMPLRILAMVFRVYPKSGISDYEAPFLLAITAVFACSLYFIICVCSPFTGRANAISPIVTVTAWVVLILLWGTGIWLISLFLERRTVETRSYISLLIATTVLAVFFSVLTKLIVDHQPFKTGYFFAYRALNVVNGVSPALPVFILAMAYFYWGWMELRREQLSSNRREYDAAQAGTVSTPPQGPAKCYSSIEQCTRAILSWRILWPAIILTVLWFCALAPWRTIRSLEGFSFDWLYWTILTALFYMTSVCYTHLLYCWRDIQKFLQALERSPVSAAFSRLRKQITWVPLIAKMPEHQYLLTSLSYETLKAIAAFKFEDLAKQRSWQYGWNLLSPDMTEVFQRVPLLEEQLQAKKEIDKTEYAQLQVYLDNIASNLASWLIGNDWDKGGSESLQRECEQFKKSEAMPQERQLQVLQEEFIALRYLVFMRYIFRHLRNLLGFVIAGFIDIVLSLSSYPFEGQRWIGLIAVLSFVVFGVGIGLVFAEMDRDAILSRLTDTNANELSKMFVFRLLQYGILPLITVLSTQVPWISKTVISALQPALEALH